MSRAQAVEKIESELRDHITRYCTNEVVATHCHNRLTDLLSATRQKVREEMFAEYKEEIDRLNRQVESAEREHGMACEDVASLVRQRDQLQAKIAELEPIEPEDSDSIEPDEPMTPEGWDADWHMIQPR